MGRKTKPDQEPYRPVDAAFVRQTPTVLGGGETPGLKQPAADKPPLRVVPDRAGKVPRLTKAARYLMTEDEFRELERLAIEFSAAAGTKIELGKLMRSCAAVMLHSKEELVEGARATGPLKRPRNEDPIGLAEFEQRLALILWKAIRKSSTMT